MTTKNAKRDYIKSFEIKGVRYNSLRYKTFPAVALPQGPRTSRPVQQAAKIALEMYLKMEAERPVEVVKKARGATFSDGLSRYFDTPAFQALRASTQAKRRHTLLKLCKTYGNDPLAGIERGNVKRMIAAREATPAAARNVLIALRHFFKERVDAGLLHEDKDPTLAIKLDKRIVKRFGEYPTWTHEHVEQFRAHWPVASMERLAFELMLLTGMAVADVIRFSRSWAGKDQLVRYARMKTNSQSIQAFTKDIQAALDACPLSGSADRPFEPILADTLGRPWYTPGAMPTGRAGDEGWRNQDFSQWFSKACRSAGLPAGIAAHGVRKRAACDDALKGWSERKLMAKFGWADNGEVVLYTRKAENERMMLAEVAKDAAD